MGFIENGFGYDVSLFFQSIRVDFISKFLLIFNYIGTEFFFIALLPIIYWCSEKKFAKRLSLIFLFNVWSNSFLKSWWKRPRPYNVSVAGKSQVNPAFDFLKLNSYGLPSGHTMSATSFFGYIFMKAKKNWLKVLSAVIIVIMPLSRLYHGVHYIQDVVVGFLLATISLILFDYFDKRVSKSLKNISLFKVIIIAFVLVIFSVVLSIVLNFNEHGVKDMVSISALLFGGVFGLYLDSKYLDFKHSKIWWKHILVVLIGFVGIAAFYIGLKFLFSFADGLNFWFVQFLRFVRYTLIAFWILYFAPLLFVKLGLMEKGLK